MTIFKNHFTRLGLTDHEVFSLVAFIFEQTFDKKTGAYDPLLIYEETLRALQFDPLNLPPLNNPSRPSEIRLRSLIRLTLCLHYLVHKKTDHLNHEVENLRITYPQFDHRKHLVQGILEELRKGAKNPLD